MKRKKVALFFAIMMLSMHIVGCTSPASKEINALLDSQETIEIMVEGLTGEEGTEVLADWVQLASLRDQEDLRKVMDDELMIINFGEDSKNGVMYVNPETEEWEPNNTLENVYKNKAFIKYWDDVEKQAEIREAVLSSYMDIEENESTDVTKLVALNGYFNIFKENEEAGQFNGSTALTRAEFMTGLARASEKADETAKATQELIDKLGENENTVYASYVIDNSYLDIKSNSLNKVTYNSLMTRAEAVYMVCKTYYSEEFKKSVEELEETGVYSDCKNAGNMTEKFETAEKAQNKSANLMYMVENPNKGLDEELYKGMLIAYNHSLLGNTEESDWDSAITKLDAMRLLVNTYLDLGTTVNCQLGNYEAEAIVDKEEDNKDTNEDTGEEHADSGEVDHEAEVLTKEELIETLGISEETHYHVDAICEEYYKFLASPYDSSPEEALQLTRNYAEVRIKKEVVADKGTPSGGGGTPSSGTSTGGESTGTGSGSNDRIEGVPSQVGNNTVSDNVSSGSSDNVRTEEEAQAWLDEINGGSISQGTPASQEVLDQADGITLRGN